MLIVSKFYDFYDSVKTYGIDKTVVYLRTESKIEIKNRSYEDSKIYGSPYEETFQYSKNISCKVNKYIIGFCGKLYPVVKFELNKNDYYSMPRSEAHYFYDINSIRSFLKHKKLKRERSFYWREDFGVLSEAGLNNFFDPNRWSFLQENFVKHKVPVFAYGGLGDNHNRDYLVLNPRLKDFEFFKAVDVTTAFQGIYMYISGVLGTPTNPMIKLTDKQLAKKKGHDGRYSFRTPPKK